MTVASLSTRRAINTLMHCIVLRQLSTASPTQTPSEPSQCAVSAHSMPSKTSRHSSKSLTAGLGLVSTQAPQRCFARALPYCFGRAHQRGVAVAAMHDCPMVLRTAVVMVRCYISDANANLRLISQRHSHKNGGVKVLRPPCFGRCSFPLPAAGAMINLFRYLFLCLSPQQLNRILYFSRISIFQFFVNAIFHTGTGIIGCMMLAPYRFLSGSAVTHTYR